MTIYARNKAFSHWIVLYNVNLPYDVFILWIKFQGQQQYRLFSKTNICNSSSCAGFSIKFGSERFREFRPINSRHCRHENSFFTSEFWSKGTAKRNSSFLKWWWGRPCFRGGVETSWCWLYALLSLQINRSDGRFWPQSR